MQSKEVDLIIEEINSVLRSSSKSNLLGTRVSVWQVEPIEGRLFQIRASNGCNTPFSQQRNINYYNQSNHTTEGHTTFQKFINRKYLFI
jgi:hypothetical protein